MSLAKDRLRIYREYLGLTQAEASKHYKIPQSNWAYYETKSKGIPYRVFERLITVEPPAGKIPIRVAWLMTGTGPMLLVPEQGPESDSELLIVDYETPTFLREVESPDAQTAVESLLKKYRELKSNYKKSIRPEHVQAAYKIIIEAADAGHVQVTSLDPEKMGLVIGLIAEQVAHGNKDEARQVLIRRAEVLLGLSENRTR